MDHRRYGGGSRIELMRRDFIATFCGGAIARPLSARAQQKAMPVIGYLHPFPSTAARSSAGLASFKEGLAETGYFEGQNVAIEYRWAEGHFERLPALAADLVARKVDVIVAAGGDESALAAQRASVSIAIVCTSIGDPVEDGLVASLARPGGNLTGFTSQAVLLDPKRFEILSELVPQAKVIALLAYANNRNETQIHEVQGAANAKRIELLVLRVSTVGEIDAAFKTIVERHAGALVIGGSPFFTSRFDQLVASVTRHAVSAIYFQRSFADAGGLISYGPDFPTLYRRAGGYVGRILRGEKPADLPIQQPAKFELVVNLKTAKTLGLTVPQSLLARADEVIE